MSLIVSIKYDESTNSVIDWLNYYNCPFQLLNDEENTEIKIELGNHIENILLRNKNLKANLNKIKSYWYRRGNIYIESKLFTHNKNSLTDCLNNHYMKEAQYLNKFLHNYLDLRSQSINGYNDNYINKLTVLLYAKECGLLIPDTVITRYKRDVVAFQKKHKEIITKPIKDGFSCTYDKINCYLHTILLTKKDAIDFPESFNYILVQEYLKKKYELRIFYLSGKFYSSAIFSQSNIKTKVDYRNYCENYPNRVIPYKLSKSIENKIEKLMLKLKLVSGSIDIIVTPTGEFYFLEINPIGQFKQVSAPCNYKLEKLIAQQLIKYEK